MRATTFAAPALITRPSMAQLEACLPAFCSGACTTPCSDFTIPTTTGLVAWIDACIADAFVLSTGAVQTAVDQSANGYVFSSGSVGPQYLATGFNFRPTLEFSGSATLQSLNYATAALGTGNTLTLFAACTLGTDINGFHANGPLFSYTAAAAGSAYNNVGSFGLINFGAAANMTFDRNTITQSTSVSYDTKMRVIFTLKSDGTKVIYIDGVAVSTVVGAVNNWVNPGYLSMGGSQFDSGFFGGNYAGLVSEWGIYSTYADATAVGLLDTYLKNKWGM